MMGVYTNSEAFISPCQKYRWLLWREWEPGAPVCLFVMLNPSRADGTEDDPTIRRCVGFARKWGFGRLEVVNLFAYRATDPRELRRVDDPVGRINRDYVELAAARATMIVCAWGVHGGLNAQDYRVRGWLAGRMLSALGHTKAGHPRHPLYARSDIEPVGL